MRYLLIQFLRKPGGQIDERVAVSKRLKNSDLTNNNVILDFASKKVEKCVVEGKTHDATFDNMVSYYRNIYPQLLAQLEKEATITSKEKK
jgi:hypothetical protein